MWDLECSMRRVESAVEELRREAPREARAPGVGAVWRGGPEGHAVAPDGRPDHAATRKYRDELAYWIAAVGGRDPAHGADFVDIFATWQKTRLNELADRLGIERTGAMDAWCSGRDAVEIGGGPIPACAFRPWRSAVAADPLAEGYLASGVVHPEAARRGVIMLPACGESLPLASRSADLVIAENCLDHTDDPARVVAEIHRVLRPGGLLWLLVDLMDHADHMHPNPMSPERLDAIALPLGFSYRYRESWEGASHPMARLQLRALLTRP